MLLYLGSKDNGREMDSEKKRKKRRFLPGLVVGFVLGVVTALAAPRWFDAYLPASFFPSGVVEGEVTEKSTEAARLLLKLETDDGVLLASFTERVEEIDLLVEKGDRVSLRVPRYEPFLTDPSIERVMEAGAEKEPERRPATTVAPGLPERESEPEGEMVPGEATSSTTTSAPR